MFWFFGQEACGILAPQPGMEPTPAALEGEVLTTGLPGKSLSPSFESHLSLLAGRSWTMFRISKVPSSHF